MFVERRLLIRFQCKPTKYSRNNKDTTRIKDKDKKKDKEADATEKRTKKKKNQAKRQLQSQPQPMHLGLETGMSYVSMGPLSYLHGAPWFKIA